MNNTIFYFTGTGNSLWVAKTVALKLGETKLTAMAGPKANGSETEVDIIGLVFPVYMWGVPRIVIRFLESLNISNNSYVFAVAVHGGQVSSTLLELNKLLKKRGIVLSAGFEIMAPSNYIPWGGPGPKEVQDSHFKAGMDKIGRIISIIRNREKGPIERGQLWQRIIFTGFHKLIFPRVPKMDRKFWIDENCNKCGICEKLCPVDNIEIINGRPMWRHHCEQCLTCIQWCPKESIQFGKRTPKYERYHNPQVTIKDILKKL